ncbi:MAG: DUF4383 domain-containing protein [Janthinobacterium lividum]
MSSVLAIESAATTTRGPVNKQAVMQGAFLLVLGVLGFIPGITSDYDELGTFHSGAHLFGVFTVSLVISSVLILFGITLLVFAGSVRQAHKAAVLSAVVLFAMGIAGAGIVADSSAPVLATNAATNWLFMGLGLVFLATSTRARAQHVKEYGVF